MTRLNNPYLALLLVPLAAFLLLVAFHVEPDHISLVGRFYAFCALGYVGARYVGRAPVLMWNRNTTPEARNVIGWSIVVVGFMFQIAYGWIYIAYDRPLWLSSQYWAASFIVLVSVGLTVVASSVPRFPTFGDSGKNGLSEVASLVVVLVSALAIFIVSHIPQAIGMVGWLLKGLGFGVLTVI